MDNVTNKIINGGFETGDFTGWSVLSESDSSGSFYIQSGTDSPVSRFPVPSPSEGSYAAMTDQYGPTSSVLFQNISLEAGLVHTLNFDYFVGNRADAFYTPDSMSVSTRSNQQFRVDILNPTFSNFFGTATDGVLANVFQTVVGSTQVFSNYQPLTFDLTSFAGSSVNLAFRMVDNLFFFQAGVDNVAVNSVNVAPVLSDTSVSLDSLNEDSGLPVGAVGTLVSQLVDIVEGAGQNNVTDAAPGAVTGIAITSANTTNGIWFYSINNGAIWNALGEVSDSNARLLAADPNTRIYFQSNDNFNGTIDNAIQFRAWDQITGINGNTADTSINGGSTSFSAATDTASITVNGVNDAPTLTGTPATLVNSIEDTVYTISQTDLLTGFTDVDGDTLSISNLTASNGTLVENNDGTWSFTGDTNYNGTINLNYNVTDGNGGSTEASQSFTLAAVNDAPTLTQTPATLVNGTEDTVYTISQTDLLVGFTDVDGDTLSISNLTASNGTLVDNNDGTWSFTGDTNYNGTINLSYNVTDGQGGSTEASQSFTLAAVNDAPTLTQTQATLVNGTEDTIYTISQTDLLAGFTDVDGDTLSISNLTASNGSLVDNNDGTWSFTGAANYNGSVNLNYNVTDGNGGSTEATQSFTLAAVNDLKGSSASETLVGTDGSDRMNGFGGHDIISGGFGSDQIYGGAGNDQIIGDITNLVGSKGDAGMDDIIYGGKGNDQIWGCGGNDSLYGGSGNDQIWGGAGDDLISGGRGNDILMGGAGSDTFVFARGSGTDTIRDFQIGQDYIAVKGTLTLEELSITQVGSQTLISDTSHNKTIAVLSGVNASELVTHASSTFFTI